MPSVDNVQDIEPLDQYTATGGQTAFPYPFPIFEDDNLVVYDNDTLQALGTDYTVSGEGDDNGGTVTFLIGRTAGHIITIYRDVPIERDTDFQQNGPRSSADMNDELDRITMWMQQLERNIGRAVRLSLRNPQPSSELELDPISSWEERYLFINADGELEPAAAIALTTLTQSLIGGLLNPQSAAELAAGVTPVNYIYPSGDFRRYGGIGDGIVNDSAAIQAALDVSAEGSIAAYAPPGTWRYTTTITVNESACLYGEGRYSILQPDDCDGLTFAGQETVGGARFFRDFALISASAVTGANRVGIKCDLDSITARITGVTFRELYIEGFGKGVFARGMWNCSFERIYGFNNYIGLQVHKRSIVTKVLDCAFIYDSITGAGGTKGVWTSEADALRPEDVQVEGCHIYAYDIGVDFEQVLNSGVRGSDIDFAKDVGVRLTQVDGGCTVRDNWIATENAAAVTCGVRLIALGAVRRGNVAIENNHITANQAFAGNIGIAGASNQDGVNVLGNRIDGFDIGISNVAGDFFTAQHNSIDAVTTAIAIDSLSEDNEIGPNLIESGTPLTFSGGTPVGFRYYARGSFTLTLTGMDAVTTGTVEWEANGTSVLLSTNANITGTSNTTAMTGTGLPTELRPRVARAFLSHVVDGGSGKFGTSTLSTGGTFTFFSGPNGDAFAAAGSKGFSDGTIVYSIS
jgi:hypothetical protein